MRSCNALTSAGKTTGARRSIREFETDKEVEAVKIDRSKALSKWPDGNACPLVHPARQRATQRARIQRAVGVELTLQLIVAQVERLWTAIGVAGGRSAGAQRHHFIEDPASERPESPARDAQAMSSRRWGSASCMTRVSD